MDGQNGLGKCDEGECPSEVMVEGSGGLRDMSSGERDSGTESRYAAVRMCSNRCHKVSFIIAVSQ